MCSKVMNVMFLTGGICRVVVQGLTRNMAYYAVAKGRKVGIYESWPKCEEQVKGFRGARYKKFPTRSLAESFIKGVRARKSASPTSTQFNTTTEAQKSTVKEFWPQDLPEAANGDNTSLEDAELLNALKEYDSRYPRPRKRSRSRDRSSNPKKFKPDHSLEKVHVETINGAKFDVDENGYVVVYTDGSCFNNGRANACAGYGVYFGDNHTLNIGAPVTGRVTNNVGEIQAAIYAVKAAQKHGIGRLCIITDSQFLIKAMTLWVKNWKKDNWQLKSGGMVKNIVDFMELDELLQIEPKIQIKWKYIKAHNGHKGNEMADQLAREGSELYRLNNSNK